MGRMVALNQCGYVDDAAGRAILSGVLQGANAKLIGAAHQCLFAVPVNRLEGGPVHVFGADCHGAPRPRGSRRATRAPVMYW